MVLHFMSFQMSIKTEKSKILHQETYMMHRFDIQRLSGKKCKGWGRGRKRSVSLMLVCLQPRIGR